MFQWIQRITRWLSGQTVRLLLFAGAILLLWGTLSPVGTVIWWWHHRAASFHLDSGPRNSSSQHSSQHYVVESADRPAASVEKPSMNCYIVFLPGVGDFSANQLTLGEEFFLSHLIQSHPECMVVSDVFPYSLFNQSLGGAQLLAPLWRAAEDAKGWLSNADVLIKIRNLWRFAISADERYGPIYNQGIARIVVDRMNATHPIPHTPDRPFKLILMGTSGGVQVALGAASYLNQWLHVKPIVVSIGGDFDGNTGFDAVEQVYHLHGSQDWIEDISRIVFASRWPWIVSSPFNRARRQGRYTVRKIGPQHHAGKRGYFGLAIVRPNTTYVDLTLQAVNQLPIWSDVH